MSITDLAVAIVGTMPAPGANVIVTPSANDFRVMCGTGAPYIELARGENSLTTRRAQRPSAARRPTVRGILSGFDEIVKYCTITPYQIQTRHSIG